MVKKCAVVKKKISLKEIVDMDAPLVERLIFKLKQNAEQRVSIDLTSQDAISVDSLYHVGREDGFIISCRRILEQFNIPYKQPTCRKLKNAQDVQDNLHEEEENNVDIEEPIAYIKENKPRKVVGKNKRYIW